MPTARTHPSVPLADVDPAKRLVLVLVGQYDRRAIAALDYASRIFAGEHRTLHVDDGAGDFDELATAWMVRAGGAPLGTVDARNTVAETVADVVREELSKGFEEVVVVIARLVLSRRWHRLLHDRSADAINAALRRVPGAFPILINVATV